MFLEFFEKSSSLTGFYLEYARVIFKKRKIEKSPGSLQPEAQKELFSDYYALY